MCKKIAVLKSCMIVLLLILTTACDDGVDSIIPQVPVNVHVNTSRSPYLLLGNGSSLILPSDPLQAGYAGIIIYKADAFTYFAFDRCCPNNVDEKHQVNADGALAVCPVDGSEFVLADGLGFRISGPAKFGLKTYRTNTTNQSDGIWLHIYN